MKKYIFSLLSLLSAVSLSGARSNRPNIIVIFADDLGYGDLSCYGHPSIRTPNLDRMAREGQRWTDFYAAAPVCTPSRAGLLTGRHPVRTGTASGVFFEWSAQGLDPAEITLAETLKDRGYATACIGKWHLGHQREFLPTNQGFDEFFGIPFSNDMRMDRKIPHAPNIRLREGVTLENMMTPGNKVTNWVPLMEGTETIEYPCDQSTLTERYTDRAIRFIESHRDQPFFLYLAQTFPHVPLFASDKFKGKSRRGHYGDVVEELDASVGRILEHLRASGLDENTLVIFTSDNGPWASEGLHGGSAGLFRGGKGMTWEGGVRAPAIFWWPGKIRGGVVVHELGSALDIMATVATLTGSKLPDDRELDSLDLSPVLLEQTESPRETLLYYRGAVIYAIRHGAWKAHFVTEGWLGVEGPKVEHATPVLNHLGWDPSENHDVAAEHPKIVAQMLALKEKYEKTIKPAPSRFIKILDYQELPDWAAGARK